MNYLIIILFIFILLLLIYFVTVKGDKKSVTLINSKGESIDVHVEIADNASTHAKGLMGRKTLGEYEGMLFVFNKSSYLSFWMFNTSIPLDAIFISSNGTVVDVDEMDPCGLNIFNCTSHESLRPAKYVLEVNKGFSKKHSIKRDSSKLVLPYN